MSRSILIIEDNHDIAKLLSLHLSDMDCRVEVAGDGVAGLRAAAARGLGELEVASSVPALVEAYPAAEGDSAYRMLRMMPVCISRIVFRTEASMLTN